MTSKDVVARVFKAALWSAIWVAFMGVVYLIARPIQHDQPVIFTIIILMAVTGSVAFVYVPYHWRRRSWVAAAVAFAIGVGSVGSHSALESSYWLSLVDDVSQETARIKAVNDAKGIVIEKQKERYATSSVGKSAAQLAAELQAAEMNDRWLLSAQCTNATTRPSKDFCHSYFELKAQHAAAMEAGNLEATVWNASTSIETTATKRDIAAAAIKFADALGYDPKTLTIAFVLLIVLTVQGVLAGALYVGYAAETPRPPREPIQPRKPIAVPDATVRLPRAPVTPWPHMVARKVDDGNSSTISSSSPPDGDGGQPLLTPAPWENEPFPDDKVPNVINTDGTPWEPDDKPSKRDLKREKKERLRSQNRAIVERFVNERLETFSPRSQLVLTAKGGHQSGGTPGDHVYTEFKQFCRDVRHPIIGKNHLGVFIGEFVDRAKNAKSVVYGCTVLPKTQTRRKAA